MLRFGILSAAGIAQRNVIPAILDANNCCVVAIASRDITRARSLAERFSIPEVFDSYDALLESEVVDAVYIPLPTSHHTDWAIKAAQAGKHVLCEKPVSLNAQSIDRIIATRDANNVVVSEAVMIAYAPLWHTIRDLLKKNTIGTLKHVEGSYCFFNDSAESTRNSVELGGGALLDVGIYPVFATRFATGQEPVRVQSKIERDPQFGTDIYSKALVDFGGFDLSFYVSTQLAARQKMVFHGADGFIEVKSPFNAHCWGAEEIEVTTRNHSQSVIYRFKDSRQYKLEVEAFSRAVDNRNEKIVTLEESRLNQSVIDAIFRASKKDGWEYI